MDALDAAAILRHCTFNFHQRVPSHSMNYMCAVLDQVQSAEYFAAASDYDDARHDRAPDDCIRGVFSAWSVCSGEIVRVTLIELNGSASPTLNHVWRRSRVI